MLSNVNLSGMSVYVRIAGSLDCWIAGLLDCWIAGLMCVFSISVYKLSHDDSMWGVFIICVQSVDKMLWSTPVYTSG